MSQQITDIVLMVRPVRFGFNDQTAVTNAFQNKIRDLNSVQIQAIALLEFDNMVRELEEAGVNVIVVEDTSYPHTPDSIFPNNWISTHTDGKLILYPMNTLNRRVERRADIIGKLVKEYGYTENDSLIEYEEKGRFLEGTGSIVFDHKAKIAYAAISPRTDAGLLNKLCKLIGYKPVAFTSLDGKGKAVYHTNVVMCIGEDFAIIGADTIPDPKERREVLKHLKESKGKDNIVYLDNEQIHKHYVGNMLQVKNRDGKPILVMSDWAYSHLKEKQLEFLENKTEIVHPAIYVIEKIGGGSARCMLAEIFKPE